MLVIDKRAQVQGAGVHALIVGVSQYRHLPAHDDPPEEASWFLNRLTSAALSAFRIYEIVARNELRLPLKTVRLLLSPSPTESTAMPAIRQSNASPATRLMFENHAREWRADAKDNADDMTFFYFAGHGLQRGPDDGVMLLEDFLEPGLPPLARCFEIGNIKNGMAPSSTFPNISKVQFYFVDACLTRPETQKKFVSPQVPEVFATELNLVDRREAPVMFSTVDGAVSLGRVGKPSPFSEALAIALQRGAEYPENDDNGGTRWPVTCLTMKTAVDLYYEKEKVGTKVKMGGVVGLPVIRYLPHPPDVDVMLLVRPENLGDDLGIWVFDENDAAVPACDPARQTKVELTLKAGLYRVQVDSSNLANSPYRSQRTFVNQSGPRPWSHNLAARLKPQ